MIGLAERLSPDIRNHIEEMEVATPLTNMRFTRNLGGSIIGFDETFQGSGLTRMPGRGPLEGCTSPAPGSISAAVTSPPSTVDTSPPGKCSRTWRRGGRDTGEMGRDAAAIGGADGKRRRARWWQGRGDHRRAGPPASPAHPLAGGGGYQRDAHRQDLSHDGGRGRVAFLPGRPVRQPLRGDRRGADLAGLIPSPRLRESLSTTSRCGKSKDGFVSRFLLENLKVGDRPESTAPRPAASSTNPSCTRANWSSGRGQRYHPPSPLSCGTW